MSTDISGPGTPPTTAVIHTGNVSISKWVNEKFPPLNEILSAHEVARLTQRHRWTLSALTLLGRFPKRQRFRGRAIGWLRSEVVDWLAIRSRRIDIQSERRQLAPRSVSRNALLLSVEGNAPLRLGNGLRMTVPALVPD